MSLNQLQGFLTICFIWTIEVYRLINNVVCALLAYDALVVFGYIRYRIRNPQILSDKKFKVMRADNSYLVFCSGCVGKPGQLAWRWTRYEGYFQVYLKVAIN